MYPMLMSPSFKSYLWGGTRLRDDFGKETEISPVAESWEISCHEDGLSRVANGEFAGEALRTVLARNPSFLGNGRPVAGRMPVLVKLIDAKESLSLQVHPGDAYAWETEGQPGKNEMWYIMDCAENAELILGFKEALPADGLREALSGGTILNYVNRIKVKSGGCYLIPAGMLHAIGGGMLIAEVQQSSNVTYRVYDYGRTDSSGKPRELHTKKALDVMDTSMKGQSAGAPAQRRAGYSIRTLCGWPYFRAELVDVYSCAPLNAENESFAGMLCVGGSLSIAHNGNIYPLRPGSSALIPAGMGGYALNGEGRAIIVKA